MAIGKTKLHSQEWPLTYQGSRRVLQNNGHYVALVPFWRAKSEQNQCSISGSMSRNRLLQPNWGEKIEKTKSRLNKTMQFATNTLSFLHQNLGCFRISTHVYKTYQSHWIICPGRVKHEQCLKPPPGLKVGRNMPPLTKHVTSSKRWAPQAAEG